MFLSYTKSGSILHDLFDRHGWRSLQLQQISALQTRPEQGRVQIAHRRHHLQRQSHPHVVHATRREITQDLQVPGDHIEHRERAGQHTQQSRLRADKSQLQNGRQVSVQQLPVQLEHHCGLQRDIWPRYTHTHLHNTADVAPHAHQRLLRVSWSWRPGGGPCRRVTSVHSER